MTGEEIGVLAVVLFASSLLASILVFVLVRRLSDTIGCLEDQIVIQHSELIEAVRERARPSDLERLLKVTELPKKAKKSA